MRLELARMFLQKRSQGDVFERKNSDGSPMSREDWLRVIFMQRIDFIHRKSTLRYEPDEVQFTGSNRIVGRIGRERIFVEADPDNKLKAVSTPRWKASLIIIDPSSHADGQKVAIEADPSVGAGFGIFNSLIQAINLRETPEPYSIELNSITEQSTFWEYVNKNRGSIKAISIEIASPNMFEGATSYEEDSRKIANATGATKQKLSIESPDGLDTSSEYLREAVDYAARGGGRLRAKSKTEVARFV